MERDGSTHGGRALVVGLVLTAVLVGGYFVGGMPGMDHTVTSGGMAPDMPMDRAARGVRHLDVADFASRTTRNAFLINVHTPYDGEIVGTDAFISYDRVDSDPRLPNDRDAEILLYCRSGRMSALALDALERDGYSNVSDLAGGMDAWSTAGRPVVTRPSPPTTADSAER